MMPEKEFDMPQHDPRLDGGRAALIAQLDEKDKKIIRLTAERDRALAALVRARRLAAEPMPSIFNREELEAPLVMKVTWPGSQSPYGVFLEFHGRITDRVIMDLKLDPFDKAVVHEPIKSGADMLQNLEIIFRRWDEQCREKPEIRHPDFDHKYDPDTFGVCRRCGKEIHDASTWSPARRRT